MEPNGGLEAGGLQEGNERWDKKQGKFVKKSCLNSHA